MDSIWREYKETKDINLKNKLIENYIDLVKIVAGRMYNYYGSKVDYDDLVGYGVLGLIDSIDKFDINKNIKFSTYAQIRIRGEIIDNIRRLDWIPRSLRTKSKELQETMSKLQNDLGRDPTNEEIARSLNINIEDLEVLLGDISSFNVYSLEEMIMEKGDSSLGIKGSNIETPEEIMDNKVLKNILVETINKLDKNEKMVISLYYYEELTYKEIGNILGLSESRISQIHSKAILNMKNNMKDKF